jgi:hypothetical protein
MAFSYTTLYHVGGNPPGSETYIYRTSGDSRATVEVAGYFNNDDDGLVMAAGDIIFVYASDGFCILRAASVSSGAVTTQAMSSSMPLNVTGDTDTATSTLHYGNTEHGTGSASKMFIPAPFAGAAFEFVIGASAGTATTVELVTAATTQTLNVQGHRTVTLPRRTGAISSIQLEGKSSTRWVVRGASGVHVFS